MHSPVVSDRKPGVGPGTDSTRPAGTVFGWDVGGAHVKVCRRVQGQVVDVAQWPCPLWQGLQHLDAVLQAACLRWPDARQARHAVTMTGEMVDLFEHRQQGVARIAERLQAQLASAQVWVFAGDAGWAAAEQAAEQWPHVASANWLATARHVAALWPGAGLVQASPGAVLVDIGSTTTDLIALRPGQGQGQSQVLGTSRSDADRLASGELVYHGVVRTPLCALGPQVTWRGRPRNVMNEFFATTADVYRLTGELQADHDQQATADGGPKTVAASRQRLARMLGLDARDGSPAEWLAMAQAWRAAQLTVLADQLRGLLQRHGLGPDTGLVSAGCGDFLVPDLARAAGLHRVQRYADLASVVRSAVTPGQAALANWAQVCAPCVAVAALLPQELG